VAVALLDRALIHQAQLVAVLPAQLQDPQSLEQQVVQVEELAEEQTEPQVQRTLVMADLVQVEPWDSVEQQLVEQVVRV
jgi:hypothetical protein